MLIDPEVGKIANANVSSDLMVCNAVWAGSKMGAIHAACLQSFLRIGHPVHLHVYEPVSDAPPGVVQVDANLLLPWS